MSYERYLNELLRPLGVYDLSAPFNGSELKSAGEALDAAQGWLDEIDRESNLLTAESWGLEQMVQLFQSRPVADNAAALGKALAALMRIGGDSFTLQAINDTLAGCGVPARAEESGVGMVTVSFPGIGGIPAGFEELKKRIEDILPAHVGIDYYFRYLVWRELEELFSCWEDIESRALTWEQLEVSMANMES